MERPNCQCSGIGDSPACASSCILSENFSRSVVRVFLSVIYTVVLSRRRLDTATHTHTLISSNLLCGGAPPEASLPRSASAVDNSLLCDLQMHCGASLGKSGMSLLGSSKQGCSQLESLMRVLVHLQAPLLLPLQQSLACMTVPLSAPRRRIAWPSAWSWLPACWGTTGRGPCRTTVSQAPFTLEFNNFRASPAIAARIQLL